ncbi:enoyl-CoA hydratase/isomerase family protein [Halovulum dunhuangense]|uniref:3-hydroxyisobutyryl-CoA hydrolase n=1 Tax=Halovulum dunhuangense TaxID=1505036 RepID=A0A849L3H2_9RHOB|nr:enoyl-CoA hydratase/isomerase family protein [Halovulum dunhuangense]NNU80764.1 enoyl-CoA hydratase/isomerase family protein [Halovulum dunhuangense]
MSDIRIRKSGRIGHVTLNRPKALNALNIGMVHALSAALDEWATDDDIACVLIDAEGARAFCAGGDLQYMYETGSRGDFEPGRRFFRDEYALNARIADFPKPYVALMQGYTMGGGVGLGCHGSHRIVGESTRMSMPECTIGLVPDVGGSLLLAHAPGRLGEYLGLSGARMDASDALAAGFADHFIPEARWSELREALIETGDPSVIATLAQDPPDGRLMQDRDWIDAHFAGATLSDIWAALDADDKGRALRDSMARLCPISMACTVELIHRVRPFGHIRAALEMEYRFTHRAAEKGDLLEGIRAQIIDKDRTPRWSHPGPDAVPPEEVSAMLGTLGPDALRL